MKPSASSLSEAHRLGNNPDVTTQESSRQLGLLVAAQPVSDRLGNSHGTFGSDEDVRDLPGGANLAVL